MCDKLSCRSRTPVRAPVYQGFVLQKELEKRASKESAVSASSGFRRVLEHIAAVRVPLVGHNCAFDLLHTTDKFFEPLPQVKLVVAPLFLVRSANV